MLRFWLLCVAFSCQLMACALCALYTPTSTISIHLEGDALLIENVEFEWRFSQDFINTLLERYDENRNGILDPKELNRIKIILENYIAKKNYLTTIEYLRTSENTDKPKQIPFQVISKQFYQEENTLIFRFKARIHQVISPSDEFSFVIQDNEEYFKFLVHTVTYSNPEPFALEYNIFNNIAFAKITTAQSVQSNTETPAITVPTQEVPKIEAEPSFTLSSLSQTLKQMAASLQERMKALQSNQELSDYALFLGISFLYGLLHAAGPGHGKALVSSYLFASNHRYAKALSMASLIALVHTFAAFLLTLVIYMMFELFFNAFFADVSYYTTKLSALLIIGIVVYLVGKKYKALSKQPLPKMVAFSTHPFACQCGACSSKSSSTDWAVVISAGIIPCPGTVTIFIFALSSGAYFLGFLAALAMSCGMSFVIALAAFSTLFAKKTFQTKAPKILVYSEILSLAIMLLLGCLLLVS